MPIDPMQIASDLARQLQDAWNAADGTAYAAVFTGDADFVAIRGDHHRTRDVIRQGHQEIFDTIYKGSTIQHEVTDARLLVPGVVLTHLASAFSSPAGPLAGEHRATATMVIVYTPEGWRIAAFHNTLVSRTGS